MALKHYDVEINGYPTTLQLSDEDAKAMGLKSSDESKPSAKAKQPANKQATPEDKATAADKRADAVSRAMNKPSVRKGDA